VRPVSVLWLPRIPLSSYFTSNSNGGTRTPWSRTLRNTWRAEERIIYKRATLRRGKHGSKPVSRRIHLSVIHLHLALGYYMTTKDPSDHGQQRNIAFLRVPTSTNRITFTAASPGLTQQRHIFTVPRFVTDSMATTKNSLTFSTKWNVSEPIAVELFHKSKISSLTGLNSFTHHLGHQGTNRGALRTL